MSSSYMQSPTSALIKRRRYQLLIHSCIYYELDQNVISDSQWNKWSEELVELQRKNPELSNQVELAEYFKDWDGSTGAFLPISEEWVIDKAKRVLHLSKNKPKKPRKQAVKPVTSGQISLF